MSGKQSNDPPEQDGDPRTLKTKRALLDSLIGLVHDRRYDEFAVADIVVEAEVGRSTFYEHYRGKDDMLVETMGGMLAVMAAVASKDDDVAALEQVLLHFQSNKKFARHFFSSADGMPAMTRIKCELTRLIAARLESRTEGRAPTSSIPLAMIASQVTEAQFALIRAWLADDEACSALVLAKAMRASAVGSISALV